MRISGIHWTIFLNIFYPVLIAAGITTAILFPLPVLGGFGLGVALRRLWHSFRHLFRNLRDKSHYKVKRSLFLIAATLTGAALVMFGIIPPFLPVIGALFVAVPILNQILLAGLVAGLFALAAKYIAKGLSTLRVMSAWRKQQKQNPENAPLEPLRPSNPDKWRLDTRVKQRQPGSWNEAEVDACLRFLYIIGKKNLSLQHRTAISFPTAYCRARNQMFNAIVREIRLGHVDKVMFTKKELHQAPTGAQRASTNAYATLQLTDAPITLTRQSRADKVLAKRGADAPKDHFMLRNNAPRNLRILVVHKHAHAFNEYNSYRIIQGAPNQVTCDIYHFTGKYAHQAQLADVETASQLLPFDAKTKAKQK